MKRRRKELWITYGLKQTLLQLMEKFNPDTMNRDFVEQKFDTIMISFYDADHRRLSGNWICNQWQFDNRRDLNSENCNGYRFNNPFAARCWDGVIINPFDGNELKVPFDASIMKRIEEYEKITDLDLMHYLWGAAMLYSKIRYIRCAFRWSVRTSDDETLVIEDGYECDATGRHMIYGCKEHWYVNDYSYPCAYDYSDCLDNDDEEDYDDDEYEDYDDYDNDEYGDEYWDDGCPIDDESSIVDGIELDRKFDEILING